jgi:hypothetical protein
MSAVSTPDVVNLFKKVYGKIHDLLPEDFELQKDIPFSEKQKVGESWVEAVILTNEVGWTLGGSSMTAFELNPSSAGSVQQATVVPYSTVLSSVVPWGVISRSAGGGEKAFYDGTKHVVKNNLKSHGKLLEILRLYGQATDLLGYVSFATATYRGVAFTNGTGTLTVNGNAVVFTNGVNTTTNWILFAPGAFAAGIWVGIEGVVVQEIDANGVIIKEGKMIAVDPLQGAIQVDFTPTAATSATSHKIGFKGQANASDMIGIVNILSATGSLFGINTAAYSLWKGNVVPNFGQKLTLTGIQNAIAQCVARGGLDGDITLYVNPRTWANLIVTESGLRMYDSSYKPGQAENGFEAITFWSQTGKITVKAHRMVKEGIAIGLHLQGDWSRSGSAEISFTVPGIPGEVIFPLQNQAGYAFRSYADQYIFCHAPAKSFIITGINDEAA